jgi:serine/threonine protein kinase/formylglycine-generating enzyme required for sulfatase activity
VKSTRQLCHCGEPAVLLGHCARCFAGMTQTVHEERRARLHPEEFKAGDTVGAGKFTLIEKLGEGGMGSVWLARDEQLSGDGVPIEVALKFIAGDRVPNATSISLLRKEVRASLRLSHPNIVRVHAWYENPGEPVFYSMEYMPGLDLKELLAQQPKGRFTFKELEPLVEQLFDALEYAHGEVGLIHRDLKPANILVSRHGMEGPGGRLKLTDFGLARPDSQGDAYATTVGGTLLYASDSQRAGGAPCVADDIYSLSAVLYHLLTGHPPYSAEDLLRGGEKPPPVHPWHFLEVKERRDIPPEPAATLMRCLGAGLGVGAPARDIPTFRKWWRTGPPVDMVERGRASGVLKNLMDFFVVALSGALAFLVVNSVCWNLGLKPYMELYTPLLARLGEWSTSIFKPDPPLIDPPPVVPIQPPDGDSASQPGGSAVETPPAGNIKPMATLSLVLDDAAFGKWDPLIQVKSLRAGGWVKVHGDSTTSFANRQQLDVTNLPPGMYRVEVGDRHNGGELTKPNPRTWGVKEIELVGGRPNMVDLSMALVRWTVYATKKVPFYIDDVWGNNYPVSVGNFERSNDSPFREAHYKVSLPYPLDQVREGQLELHFPADVMRQYRMEELKPIPVTLRVGRQDPILIPFVSWTHPRMDASWTNHEVGMVFLPVAPGAGFLAGQTEVTVGQYRIFARETKRGVEPLESVTPKGWEMLGRTWETAFPGQTDGHPVVGVAWEEAAAFCEWLTARERGTNRLLKTQRYALPTADQWTLLAGGTEYPWGDNYPPGVMDGNYAGKELGKLNWPEGWEDLSLDSRDTNSVWTVPVERLRPDSRGFFGVGGNAAEWCDTWYELGLNASISWSIPSKRLSDDGGGRRYRVVRGASWADSDPDLLKTKVHWAEVAGAVGRIGLGSGSSSWRKEDKP